MKTNEIWDSKSRNFTTIDPNADMKKRRAVPGISAVQKGKVQGYDAIWFSHADITSCADLYLVGKDGKAVALVDMRRYPDCGENAWQVKRVVVARKLRNTGIGKALYLFLIKELGIALVSDTSHQTHAKKLWASLGREPGIKLIPYDLTYDKFDPDATRIYSNGRYILVATGNAPITETVADDVNVDAIAKKAAQLTTQYVWNRDGLADAHWVFDEFGEYLVFYPDKIGLTADLGIDDLVVMVGTVNTNAIGMHGMVAVFDPPHKGYSMGIILNCLPPNHTIDSYADKSMVKKKVGSVEALEVLSHEFLHYFDKVRSRGNRSPNRETHDSGSEYYNDPAEFNAYYHDLVGGLLSFIRRATAEPDMIKDYAELYGVNTDFRETVKTILRPNRQALRGFIRWLNDNRRKSLIKRLYKLHLEIKRILEGHLSEGLALGPNDHFDPHLSDDHAWWYHVPTGRRVFVDDDGEHVNHLARRKDLYPGVRIDPESYDARKKAMFKAGWVRIRVQMNWDLHAEAMDTKSLRIAAKDALKLYPQVKDAMLEIYDGDWWRMDLEALYAFVDRGILPRKTT